MLPLKTGIFSHLFRFREGNEGDFFLRRLDAFRDVGVGLGVDVVRLCGVVVQQRRRRGDDRRRVNPVRVGRFVLGRLGAAVSAGHALLIHGGVFDVVDAIGRVFVLAEAFADHTIGRFVA